MKPRLLDLFCCAGAGARGYAAAGFEVVGMDIEPQPHYPYEFRQMDVLALSPWWIKFEHFAAVHASPPCQRYTELRHRYTVNEHPDLIGPVRDLLVAAGKPYIIENVEDAGPKLKDPTLLCGLMFPGLRVFRHRLFETSFAMEQPEHPSHRGIVCHTFDKRKRHYGTTDEWTDFVQVTGGGNCRKDAAADAMGLAGQGLTKQELNEGLPPAYTRWIGERLIAQLQAREAA